METKEVKEMQKVLVDLLKEHLDVLRITSDTYEKFEVIGNVETMQWAKKVDGIYFASVVPKPKDVRFYFFPIYTHKEKIGELPEQIKKFLKGKSCFHIKKINDEILKELKELIDKSIKVYKKEGLLK